MSRSVSPPPDGFRFWLPWYVGQVANAPLDQLAAAIGLPLHHYDEDGLGPATALTMRLSSGLVVLLTEHEHYVRHFGQTGPTVEADIIDVIDRGPSPILSETLDALGLSRAHIAHEPSADIVDEARKVLAANPPPPSHNASANKQSDRAT